MGYSYCVLEEGGNTCSFRGHSKNLEVLKGMKKENLLFRKGEEWHSFPQIPVTSITSNKNKTYLVEIPHLRSMI